MGETSVSSSEREANVPFQEQETTSAVPSLHCGVGEENREGGEALATQPSAGCRRLPGDGDEAGYFPGHGLGPSASSGYLLQSPKDASGRKGKREVSRSEDFPFLAGLVLVLSWSYTFPAVREGLRGFQRSTLGPHREWTAEWMAVTSQKPALFSGL